jgi:hypothetical protein
MVSELGALYSLEVEASAFPEISAEQALKDVHMAVLRATDAMSNMAARPGETAGLERARAALDAALSSATSARSLLATARAARNRKS